MKKIILIFFITLLSYIAQGQTENIIYGKKIVIKTRDTSSAELQIINSTRNVLGFLKNTGTGNTIFKILGQSDITALSDSLLARYTRSQADALFKSITWFPSWSEVTAKPSNFTTTYALSNDLQDSILNRLRRSNNLSDLTDFAAARSNLSVYSISQINTALLDYYTKTQADALLAAKASLSDSTLINAGRWLPNRSIDTATALQARIQTKEPLLGFTPVTNARTLTINGTTYDLTANRSWSINSMVYPSAGIPVSTGTAWGTSITDNSSQWNAAYGWGNHATAGYQATSAKGVANGYADLDALGKVPASRLDFGQIGQTYVVASQAAMLAVSGANIGALAIRTDNNRNYRLIASPASTLANWQVLAEPDAPVQSVNGFTGNVNLLTTHISEGSNLYWTAARSRAAQSLTTSGNSGASTYDNTTGVLNVPAYTLSGLGGISGNQNITLSGDISGSGTTAITTAIGALKVTDGMLAGGISDSKISSAATWNAKESPLTFSTGLTRIGNTITNNITQYTDALARAAQNTASSTVTGLLTSTDWNTFNGKQAALSGTGFVKATGTTISYDNSTYLTTAGTAANSTLWAGYPLNFTNSAVSSYLMSWNGSQFAVSGQTEVRTFLGLGSYAYRSSGLAELSGANFTGTLTNTSYIQGGYLVASGSTGLLVLTSADWGTSSEVRNNTTINGVSGGDFLAFKNPSGKGFTWTVNGGSVANISSAGALVTASYIYSASGYVRSDNNTNNFLAYGFGSANYGNFAAISATEWAIGYTPSASSVGTSVIKWSSSNLVSIAGSTLLGTAFTSSQKLQVGYGASSGYIHLYGQSSNMYFGQDGTGAAIISDRNAPMYFYVYNAVALSIGTNQVVTASAGIVATSFTESDSTLKNIYKYYTATDGIGAIEYFWKPELKKDNKTHWGYVAQLVQQQYPDMVMLNNNKLVVNYTEVHTMKIQKLEERVSQQDRLISDLTTRLIKLENSNR